jgi:type I restriction-modification system DNA methylase subunit
VTDGKFQYKDFVFGLVFLKYVSDSFEERRAQSAKTSSRTACRRRGRPRLSAGDFRKYRTE